MSAHLDSLVAAAASNDARWTPERAGSIRVGVLRRHERNVRRERMVRRGLFVAGGAALLLMALLRGATSAPAEPQLAEAKAPTSEALASRALADAGYVHD